MKNTITIMVNELRLLTRDRAGLMLLFVMPVFLALVLTLVQDNILKGPEPGSIHTAIVNLHDDPAADLLVGQLSASEGMARPRFITNASDAAAACEQALNSASAHFCIIIPEGFSQNLKKAARKAAAGRLKSDIEPDGTVPAPSRPVHLQLFVDPGVRGATRAIVTGSLTQSLARIEAAETLGALKNVLFQRLADEIAEQMGMPRQMITNAVNDDIELQWPNQPLVTIETPEPPGGGSRLRLPTAAQHNVPAWALFGMFFIVVPISGTMIRERQSGLFTRLQTLPVSPLATATGKLLAYAQICLVQFAVVMLMGRFLLPVLGVERLEVAGSPMAVIVISLFCALAAAAYGVMVGTLANTQEQAAAIGPVSVVAAAAVGGLMVPVFAMPKAMQALSQLSPLAWGHSAYLEIFLRGGTVEKVGMQVLLLVIFAGLNLAAAGVVAKKRRSLQ